MRPLRLKVERFMKIVTVILSPELGYVQEQMIRFSFYMESEEENTGLCVGPICVGGGGGEY